VSEQLVMPDHAITLPENNAAARTLRRSVVITGDPFLDGS
jgi:hypothetical protein